MDQPMDQGGAADAPAQQNAAAGATPESVKSAERAAGSVQKRLTTHALPIRQYLESTVVPLLMQGLQSLCKERPEDPVEYLANYLLQHNPKKGSSQKEGGGSAAAQAGS